MASRRPPRCSWLDTLGRQRGPQGPLLPLQARGAGPGREASGAWAHNGPFLPSFIETVRFGIFKQLYIHRLKAETIT